MRMGNLGMIFEASTLRFRTHLGQEYSTGHDDWGKHIGDVMSFSYTGRPACYRRKRQTIKSLFKVSCVFMYHLCAPTLSNGICHSSTLRIGQLDWTKVPTGYFSSRSWSRGEIDHLPLGWASSILLYLLLRLNEAPSCGMALWILC